MGQLSQYIKSSYELDTEFKLNGLKHFLSENSIPAHKIYNIEEILPGEPFLIKNGTEEVKQAEDSGIEKNVDDTKLNPETETEIKDPDPDEPFRKSDKGFDERKKNKNQPL